MFSNDICYISQNYHFMFLIDIDPISMSFHHFPAPAFSKNVTILDFQDFEIYKHNMFLNVAGISWFLSGILASPKINNIGFGDWGQAHKSRNHRHEGFWVL